ncbi:MAG: glycerophosphodiester phosphodiesterase family protein [Marmoricola sp.]
MRPWLRLVTLSLTLACVLTMLVASTSAPPADAAGLNLRSGSKGPAVRTLEGRLKRLKVLPPTAVDRYYRAATVNAVRLFQRQQRVPTTGRVNRNTWNMIARAVTSPFPAIIGHRGASMPGVPENTIRALQHASAYAGMIEFDLRVTADREFVLMHDASLARTTNCTGQVAARTLDYLRTQCLAGDQPVPTLEEAAAYLATVPDAIAPELKVSDLSDEELDHVLQVLRDEGLLGRTYLQSFSPSVLTRVRGLDPSVRTVLDSRSRVSVAAVKAAGAGTVAVEFGALGPNQVTTYKRAGLNVWVFTARTRLDLATARYRRANAVITDNPRLASTYYRR